MHMKVSTTTNAQTVLMGKTTTQFMLVSPTNAPLGRSFLNKK